jgi:putative signal transducing protein
MNPEENPTAFVKLVTANGLSEADVWKAVLEASGIQVFLRHEAMAAVIPETAGEIAAVDLWVSREQAAEALQILQDERVEPAEEDEPV